MPRQSRDCRTECQVGIAQAITDHTERCCEWLWAPLTIIQRNQEVRDTRAAYTEASDISSGLSQTCPINSATPWEPCVQLCHTGSGGWQNEFLFLQPGLQGDSRETAPPGTQGPEEGGMAGEGWLVHTNPLLGALPGLPSLILEQDQSPERTCDVPTAALIPLKKDSFWAISWVWEPSL